jgi:hypothetical protein
MLRPHQITFFYFSFFQISKNILYRNDVWMITMDKTVFLENGNNKDPFGNSKEHERQTSLLYFV